MSVPRSPSARTLAPFWVAPGRGLSFERTRLAGRLEVDVVVLGSGLTAALAAAWLARDGRRVALVTSEAIGDESACGMGMVGSLPAVSVAETRAVLGIRATRALWSTTRKAGVDLVATLTRWRAPVGLQRLLSYLVASDAGSASLLERERVAFEACGVEATWLGPSRVASALGLEGAVALRVGDADAAVDPVRATLACARAAVASGAICLERLAIDRIVRTRQGVELQAGKHTVAAATLVVATTTLPREYGALARHLASGSVAACVLPPSSAASRRRFGRAAMCEAVGDTGLAWRLTSDSRLVVTRLAGEGLRLTGDRPSRRRAMATPLDPAATLNATGALMYDVSLRYPHVSGEQPASRWCRAILTGADGLPVASAHRAFPSHFFAFARADRLAECALAARVVVSQIVGRDHPATPWMDFSRLR